MYFGTVIQRINIFYTKADIDKIYNKREWAAEWIYTDPNEQ